MLWAGWREVPHAERYQQMARDYVAAIDKGESALVVSPTHAEGARITAEIRDLLVRQGVLGSDQRTFLQLENSNLTDAERSDAVNYRPGDMLVFHQNAKGYARGERLEVTDGATLPVDQSQRYQVFHAAH